MSSLIILPDYASLFCLLLSLQFINNYFTWMKFLTDSWSVAFWTR